MEPQSFICSTCGTEYEVSGRPPAVCKICTDERQYVNQKGQSWMTLPEVNEKHTNIIEEVTGNLFQIYSAPAFAIGQRAYLLKTPNGNVLWDCIANIDDSTIRTINNLGGIAAIAISHPHYYTTVSQWSKAFGNAPVYLHQKDEEWICKRDFNLKLWAEATKQIMPGVTLINCGGHFDGATVLHYENLLLVGDVVMVCPDLKTVSFMYSYPNYIPLPKGAILNVRESLKPFLFDAMYGAFGNAIRQNAEKALQFSIDRYLKIYE